MKQASADAFEVTDVAYRLVVELSSGRRGIAATTRRERKPIAYQEMLLIGDRRSSDDRADNRGVQQ